MLPDVPDFRETLDLKPIALMNLLRHARDLLRLVPDALEIRYRLADRHDQAQIGCRGLPPDDDMAAVIIDAHLVAVNAQLGFDHLLEQLAVTRGKALDCRKNLRFDEPAHLQDAGAQGFEVGVVLFGKMFARA